MTEDGAEYGAEDGLRLRIRVGLGIHNKKYIIDRRWGWGLISLR